MIVKGMGWSGIIAEQYELMQTFMAERLGMTLVHELEDFDVSMFRLPSGQLCEVFGPANRQRYLDKYQFFNGHAVAFEVDDLDNVRQRIIDHGVRFMGEIQRWEDEVWCEFVGPEDRLFTVQQVNRGPAPNSMGIQRFSWAGLVAEKFDETIHFFTHAMQMSPLPHDADSLSIQFSLSNDDLFEVLRPDHPWHAHLTHVTIGFEVDDVSQTRARMEAAGVEFLTPIETIRDGHTFTFFRDLEDYRCALWKPVQT